MSAFSDIYKEYGKPVYRFLLSLTGDEGQAEELLQETFYQAFLHIDRFEGRSSLYTWLCQIGKNAWLKECRRSRRYSDQSWEDLTLPAKGPPPEEGYIQKEEAAALRRAILRLPDPYRDVFILHSLGALKLKEIAQTYGRTESWARVTYYRAKQMLRETLDG